MKTFNVFCRDDKKSYEVSNEIKDKLLKKELLFEVDNPELVVCIGGDGTILKAIHHYLDKLDNIIFCGVHTGSLGFYTDFKVNEVDDLVERIALDNHHIKEFNMVEMKVDADGKDTYFYALNEGRIENNQHTQVMEVFVNGYHFETIRGNGLNFATPSGSTGYNKSLGGAVMHPITKAIQMCEIASINNLAYRSLGSPLIIDQSQNVRVEFKETDGAILGYDSFSISLEKEFKNIDSITFRLSDKCVKFARYRSFAFMDRVKRNFVIAENK